jgi:hypothetical protein
LRVSLSLATLEPPGMRSRRRLRACVERRQRRLREVSLDRRDGLRIKRGYGSRRRAATGGRPRAPVPRIRGTLHQADRGSPRSLTRDGQGLLLGPNGREGARGQGALPGSVSRLRGVHRATERQGRRLRVLQTVPSRRDRAAVDTGAGPRSDARVASALRRCAVLLRLARTHALRRGGEALKRLQAGEWPASSTVTDLYGAWAAAIADAFGGA